MGIKTVGFESDQIHKLPLCVLELLNLCFSFLICQNVDNKLYPFIGLLCALHETTYKFDQKRFINLVFREKDKERQAFKMPAGYVHTMSLSPVFILSLNTFPTPLSGAAGQDR